MPEYFDWKYSSSRSHFPSLKIILILSFNLMIYQNGVDNFDL